ncbi:MAG: patatin-like phospholipase family protein [Myxococcaceae bacterium]
MPTLREWLKSGPYTLALSAGYFGFFAHAGALAVLEEEGLLPAKVCGASAGALVAGLWAAGMNADGLKSQLLKVQRKDFWDPGWGAGLLKGQRFAELLESILPNATFENCRVPVGISVYDTQKRTTCVLTRGSLSPAIRASCALPVLFHPVAMNGTRYADGGVVDRPGVAGASADARVLCHYLPSKSPWRFFYSPAQIPKAAPGHVIVATTGLPRSGPFSLHVGAGAMAHAAAAFRARLDLPALVLSA